MTHLVQKNQGGLELTLWQQYQDTSAMSERLKQPIRGISLSFIDFGYKEVLGLGFGLTQHLKFPVLAIGKNLFLDYSIGAGCGFITTHYDVETNPKNNAIGSNLNSRVDMEFSLTHYLKKFHYGIGVAFAHFSNGALKNPNLGLNSPGIFLTGGYNFQERMRQKKNFGLNKRDDENHYSDHSIITEIIFTAKEVSDVPLIARVYPVIACRFSYIYRPGIKWGFETSTDLTYNGANQHFYPGTDYSFFETIQLGIYGGGIAYFHKSAVVLGGGLYLVDEINVSGRIYNRLGFQHYFSDRLYISFAIKANFAKAEYFEFGLGYKFIRSE
ncbi:acyloxyacyl hydrolase [Crocinitomix catalasitica]|nr:acyloxyacyl hydrolase [Crocinitomix catalasitica]